MKYRCQTLTAPSVTVAANQSSYINQFPTFKRKHVQDGASCHSPGLVDRDFCCWPFTPCIWCILLEQMKIRHNWYRNNGHSQFTKYTMNCLTLWTLSYQLCQNLCRKLHSYFLPPLPRISGDMISLGQRLAEIQISSV